MDKLTAPLDEFKEREIEIITLMAAGLSNKEISETLFLAKETVRWYNKQIYSKLGTSRRVEAVSRARQFGLIGENAESAAQVVRQKLPVTTGPFIGRDEELSDLAMLLAKPEVRLLSLVAAGGMGKSRLAVELGHQITSNYEHGAAFIDLTPAQTASDVAKFAISSLGLRESDGQPPQEVLFNYCRDKSLLLIFDNFEDVLAGASLLSDLLQTASNVAIVVTTRERLNLRVETAYYLYPVMKSGSKLFQEVSLMMHPNLHFEEDDQAEIDRIVQAVGGLPLALILAATWLDVLTIPEIVAEIEANLDFLSSEMGDMPKRQQSIQAVIDPTWKQLNAKEQKAFMWTAVFRGGFTREAFQKMTGASLRTIQTLLRRSLITQGNGRRYNLHPLIRQYAYEKLESSQMTKLARHAHLKTFITVSGNQNDKMYGGYYLDALNALENDHENFLGALDWSFDRNHIEDGISLLLNLCQFWQIRSQSKTAVSYLKQALTFKQNAELHLWLGRFQWRLEQTDEIIDLVKTAVSMASNANATNTVAIGYYVLGYMYEHQDLTKASNYFEKSLAIAKKHNNKELIAFCLTALGNIVRINKNFTKALQNCEQAMEIYEERGDLRGISMITYNMSLIHKTLSNGQKARELCEQSLRTKWQIGDKAGAARRLSILAGWDFMDEEIERAHQYLAESVAISEELGEQKRLHYALSIKGTMLIATGQYKDAQTTLERALALTTRFSIPAGIAWNQSNLGLLYLIQGKVEEASPHIIKALKAIHQTDFDPWIAMTAYANYLWFQHAFEPCASIAATLSLALEKSESANEYIFNNRYFLLPLIHRVKKKLGEDRWQDAREAAYDLTVRQQFEKIAAHLQL